MNKKNKFLVVVLAVLILMTSGCTKYMSDENKKRITNEVTGQALTSNILCLPEDENLLNKYIENKDRMTVKYDSLKSCKDFSPSDIEYSGIWESIFVKPLAWLMIKIGLFVGNYGLSVMILGILIRLILLPFSRKSLMQSENMKKAQPELNALQRKYGQITDRETQMRMSQEMMMIYKKYNINPAGGCVTAFIQIPILFAFLEAINRVPAIFEGYLLGLQLGTSPLVGIKNGNLLYILVIVLIIASTYFSYKNMMGTTTGDKNQDQQTSMMMKYMIVFISIASLSLPTALALYWIVTNVFMIVQNFVIKKIMNKKSDSSKVIKYKEKKKKASK